ncbi:hypothetical protein K1719_031926 [Acacia pycnantha]|nr:hypothetical protein K1719_031926 [Acacia pycnantha]
MNVYKIMVFHCKPPLKGQLGCQNECPNRLLNIECVQGACPCRDLCSNQQFQKHNYAKMKWFKCGKKGYGLKAIEDISARQFLIEYVGEQIFERIFWDEYIMDIIGALEFDPEVPHVQNHRTFLKEHVVLKEVVSLLKDDNTFVQELFSRLNSSTTSPKSKKN